jgi:hypothetical protein
MNVLMAVAAAVAGVLALIAGAVIGRAAVSIVALARRSSRWPTVPGRVLRSEIRDGRASIRYEYVVQEQRHEASEIVTAEWPYQTRRTASRRVERYPPDRQVTVCYDAQRPTLAMLEPGFSTGVLYLPLVASVLLVIAIALLAGSNWRLFLQRTPFG